ncbi:MAG: hypothetical protein ACREGB_01705, partial [Candidatus Saccharimonadales bacterium]
LIPKKLLTDIADNAFKITDVDTLLKMADMKVPPNGVIDKLSKLSVHPDALDDNQLQAMTETIAIKPKTSAANTKSLLSALIDRATTLAATPNPDYATTNRVQEMKISALKATTEVLKRSPSDPTKVAFAAKLLNSMRSDPDSAIAQYATDNVFNGIVTNESITPDTRAKAFVSMPEVYASEDDAFNDYPTVGRQFVNHPDVVKTAQSGWKLKLMLANIRSAEPNTASTLIGRSLTFPMSDADTKHLMYNVLNASDFKAEDVIKAARTFGEDVLDTALRRSNNYNEHNPLATSVHAILPLMSDQIGERIKNATPLTLNDVTQKIRYIAHWAGSCNSAARAIGAAEKLDAIDTFVDKLLSQSEEFTRNRMTMLGQIKTQDQGFEQNFMQSAVAMSNSLTHLNRIHSLNEGQSMRALREYHKQDALQKAYKSRFTPGDLLGGKGVIELPESYGQYCANFLDHNKIADSDWPELAILMPEFPHFFHKMDKIPAAAMDNIDLPQFISRGFLLDASTRTPATTLTDAVTKLEPGKDKIRLTKKITEAVLDHYRETEDDTSGTIGFLQAAFKNTPEAFDIKSMRNIKSAMGSDIQWHSVAGVALQNGIGGPEFVTDFMKGIEESRAKIDKDSILDVAKAPHMDDAAASSFLGMLRDMYEPNVEHYDILAQLASNPYLSATSVRNMFEYANDSKIAARSLGTSAKRIGKVYDNLTMHPNVDQQTFTNLYEQTKQNYGDPTQMSANVHPAFLNAKFGGDLFRSLSVKAPEAKIVPNVDGNKLITSTEHAPGKDRMAELMKSIPPEGITWANFKRVSPKMEKWPEVKALFMSKQNAAVMPEDVVEEMKKHDNGQFHVTYTSFSGAQRHNDTANLVMQINNSKQMEEKINKDPKLWAFFQFIQKAANNLTADSNGNYTIGGHPITPHAAGWTRLDTGAGKKGFIVEEFQSDFSARLDDEIKAIEKNGKGTYHINGYHITPDEMKEYANQIRAAVQGWFQASWKGVIDLAKKQGCEALYLHGPGIRAHLSGMDPEKENPVWHQEMYQRYPANQGWEKIDYTDYPENRVNRVFLEGVREQNRPTHCWRLKLK